VTFLRDPDSQIARRFGVFQIPMLVIIDKAGVVRDVDSGIIHLDEVKQQVAELDR
jgi:hypothetical protein